MPTRESYVESLQLLLAIPRHGITDEDKDVMRGLLEAILTDRYDDNQGE